MLFFILRNLLSENVDSIVDSLELIHVVELNTCLLYTSSLLSLFVMALFSQSRRWLSRPQ